MRLPCVMGRPGSVCRRRDSPAGGCCPNMKLQSDGAVASPDAPDHRTETTAPNGYRFGCTAGGRDNSVPSSLKVAICIRSGETSTRTTVLVPPTTMGYARCSSAGNSA